VNTPVFRRIADQNRMASVLFASDRKAKTVERRIINPWTWQDQMGYVQANEVSGTQRTLFCAGQTSVDEEGRPMHAGDMGAQLAQALDNLETVLGAAGAALSDVMRLNTYTTDMDLFFERMDRRTVGRGRL
jgi:enamine deaminase RidA (YjgF/YER057c/UK114 family)